jgi:hypothetical protein
MLLSAMFVFVQTQFTCTAIGRFPVSDSNCRNYTMCVQNTANNSLYIAYNYVCPTTSVFNPNTRQCTAADNYDCTN